jgi:phosphoglycerate dehydrogenase-like enzyme
MAGESYRIALSSDFLKPDGTPSFPEFDLEPLRQPGIELFHLPRGGPEIRAEDLADVDALILLGSRFTAASIPVGDRLALVARFGVGYDNVDVPACSERGIAVVITPDGVRRPVAVSILTLMLALTGKLFVKDRLARQGPEGWAQKTQHNGVGLVGLTLGSVGFGNIGRELFRLAKPLDMRFIAADPMADAAQAAEMEVELVDLPTLFRTADIVAVNCFLSEQTRGLVSAELLGLMKPTAYLINTARGPIVDQQALTRVLQGRRIAGAGLDVLEKEPPDADDPIVTLDNVIVTPHALCWTDQLFAALGSLDAQAALEVRAGRVPVGLVDRGVTDNPAFKAKLERNRERFGKT